MNKFVEPRPLADPETAARKIMEIAHGLGDLWDGRLFVEKLNSPMRTEFGALPAEQRAGIGYAVEKAGPGDTRAAHITASRRSGKDLFA